MNLNKFFIDTYYTDSNIKHYYCISLCYIFVSLQLEKHSTVHLFEMVTQKFANNEMPDIPSKTAPKIFQNKYIQMFQV